MSKKKRSVIDKIGAQFVAGMGHQKGRFGEIAFEFDSSLKGNPVTRTGVGSDYKDKRGHLYEIKTGKAKLTRAQEEERRKKGEKYHLIRVH